MMSTFISYSRADSSFALRLAKNLKSAGFDVWLDQLDIQTGERWDDEVEAALEACKIFMIILSPESLESQNVKDEIGYAIDAGKYILPVKIKSGEIPFRLRRFQYVDFSRQSYQESLKEIKSLLSGASPGVATKEVDQEPEASEAQPTVKRIKAITSSSNSHVTEPGFKRLEPASSSTPRAFSRGLLIGIAAVGVMAVAGLLIRTLFAGISSAATPRNEAPVAASSATVTATAEPTSDTNQVTTPVEPTSPEAFMTEFTKNTNLDDWEYFVLGTETTNKVKVSPADDGLVFNVNGPDLHAYYIYRPETYGDAAIRMKTENLGQNSYQVSLICRKMGNQWFEYTIVGGGLWRLYEYRGQYNSVTNGGTFNLNPGKSVNEYEMRCRGDELSLHINGYKQNTYKVGNDLSPEGQIGFSVSTNSQVFPIDVKVLEFEISN